MPVAVLNRQEMFPPEKCKRYFGFRNNQGECHAGVLRTKDFKPDLEACFAPGPYGIPGASK